MPKRIDDQTRFITFVMEADLSAVEATLKNANAIFASRKKSAGSANGTAVEAAKPVIRRRRTTSTPPVAEVAAAQEPAVNAVDSEF